MFSFVLGAGNASYLYCWLDPFLGPSCITREFILFICYWGIFIHYVLLCFGSWQCVISVLLAGSLSWSLLYNKGGHSLHLSLGDIYSLCFPLFWELAMCHI